MMIEPECSFCGSENHTIGQCDAHNRNLAASQAFEAEVAAREAAINSLPVAVSRWLLTSH